jgi:hypothetical protein
VRPSGIDGRFFVQQAMVIPYRRTCDSFIVNRESISTTCKGTQTMAMEDIDKRLPLLTEKQIIDAFTDDELCKLGEGMGYIFPRNVKFPEETNQSKHQAKEQ